MSFVANLKHKVEVDRLYRRVRDSLQPLGSGRSLDVEAVRELLQKAGYQFQTERNMTLASPDFSQRPGWIVVVDQTLPLYHTTLADVLLRKNPTIKEMVNLRKAIKILNDKDVVMARGAQTAEQIRQAALKGLDWTYGPEDIVEICETGTTALETADTEAVRNTLTLLAELLDWDHPPGFSGSRDLFVLRSVAGPGGETAAAGDIIVYSGPENRLLRFGQTGTQGPGAVPSYRELAENPDKAGQQGREVLDGICQHVLKIQPAVRSHAGQHHGAGFS